VTDMSAGHEKPKVKLLNDPKFRAYIFQAILVAFITWVIWGMISNAAFNLKEAGIASGFDYLRESAGFDANFSPFLFFGEGSTYLDAYLVGLQNTLFLAIIGVFFATVLGFLVGIARLSPNWVVGKMAYWYVEVMRNIPVLLQIFIWYKGVGAFLPDKRNPLDLGFLGQLNAAGLYAPKPVVAEGVSLMVWALALAVLAIFFIAKWAKKRQMATGERFPVFWTSVALLIGLPLVAYFIAGQPISAEYPTAGNFGPRGGMQIIPEFIALLLALSTYTAAFIAEIVRAGIMAVNKGQSEASYALGLTRGQTLRLNIIPQALRVIIPPLTSQYLNLTKNSSLAVAIGFKDLTAMADTSLTTVGQAVEIISMIMVTYLLISLATSMFMNWYNAKMSLVER